MNLSNKNLELFKIIKGLKKEDYRFHCSYNDIESVCEIIRRHLLEVIANTPLAIQKEGKILFVNKQKGDIRPDYLCEMNGEKYDLFELNIEAYNRIEPDLIELQNQYG